MFASGLTTDAAPARSLHESLIEMLPDAVLALDVEVGRFVLVNSAAERLLDTPRAQLLRQGLRDLIRPWDTAQLERLETGLRTEAQWRGDLWLKRQDGTFVPTEVAAQVWNLDGRTLVQLCCRDMSARWRDDAMRQVIGHAAERLAATIDDRDALRTVVTAALPGLADAALVELDAVEGDEPMAVAAYSDPGAPGWPAPTVDESPAVEIRDMVRRGNTLTIPLVARGSRIGTLILRRTTHRVWEATDQPLAEALAGHAAHAIEQTRQLTAARQELSLRASMLRILSTINTDITPRGVYEILLEEAQLAIQAEDGGGTLWDYDRGLLCPGLPKLGTKTHCAVDPRLMVSIAASERCSLIDNEYQRTRGNQTPAGRAGAWAVLAVPMVHQERLIGSLSISRIMSARRFQPSEARRLDMLASAAATTLAGIDRQRAVGAQVALREAAHLLNNDLALTMGSLDLLSSTGDLPTAITPLVDTALQGVSQAAAHLAQLQRIRRVETYQSPLGLSLDLDRSTDQSVAL
jgi:PAS domain S-box-containing protein